MSFYVAKYILPILFYYTISFLLKNEISKQLAALFNLSFITGVFLPVLKTAKVVPVFTKESKLGCSNYRPIFLSSKIEKILEKQISCRKTKMAA